MAHGAKNVAGKEPASVGDTGRHRFNPRIRKISWMRKWQPTPVFLPGESRAEESGRLQSLGSKKSGTQLSD